MSDYIDNLVSKGKLKDAEVKKPKFIKTESGFQEAIPFIRYKEDVDFKKPILSVRLNKEEFNDLQVAKDILNQSKDSTAIKQLAKIGMFNVIHDEKMKHLLSTIFGNRRKNARIGIVDFE
jgi:hypothetical protein